MNRGFFASLVIAVAAGCSFPAPSNPGDGVVTPSDADPADSLVFVPNPERPCEGESGASGYWVDIANTSRNAAIVANVSVSFGEGVSQEKTYPLEPGEVEGIAVCSDSPEPRYSLLGARYLGDPDSDIDAFDHVAIVEAGPCRDAGRGARIQNSHPSRAIVATMKRRLVQNGHVFPGFNFRTVVIEPGGFFSLFCFNPLESPELVGARYLP